MMMAVPVAKVIIRLQSRVGKDFYVYAEPPASGVAPAFVLSARSTYPDGTGASGDARSADNTRKIGGFHCLCADVGDIADHALCDYVEGDILPFSVWDLNNRPVSNPEGMVKSVFHTMTNADNESVTIPGTGIWVDIYLASYSSGLQSAYDAAVLDGATGDPPGDFHWYNFLSILLKLENAC